MKIKINGIELNSQQIYKSNFFLYKKPTITSNKKTNDYLYITLIVDPDAPYPSNPTKKYFLHLMVVNSTDVIVDYYPPHPPVDSPPHRYQVLLFQQEQYIQISKLNQHPHPNFNLNKFVSKYNLKIVDKFEFLCEN
jgi:phosphatidylethanolamine-binding protein (PEBP) family uncharacterized protein